MTNPNLKKVQNVKSTWYLWLFPLFALMISAWLFMEYFNQRGPSIKIAFDDGSSIQAEKTRIRYRGVGIGLVKKVTISEDGKSVIAHVTLQRDAEHFAVEGSKFWMVTPKVNFQGVSGLETLFEGTYIAVQPGPPKGAKTLEFKGRLSGESNESMEDTTSYFLETNHAESVGPGDSVTFRGLKIGSVTKVTLSKTAQMVVAQINVENRYVKLIRTNTVFWRKVGVQAKLGLFNSELKINALDSLLHGGVDLFTPDAPGEIANAQAHFPLLSAPPKGWEKWNPKLEFN